MSPQNKSKLTLMDIFSISMGVLGLIAGLVSILYMAFSVEAGVETNATAIDVARQEIKRVEAKHDADNNQVLRKLEKIDEKMQSNYDRTDEKLDRINQFLLDSQHRN